MNVNDQDRMLFPKPGLPPVGGGCCLVVAVSCFVSIVIFSLIWVMA